MKKNLVLLIVLIAVLILTNIFFFISFNNKESTYSPEINPNNFSPNINNKYFSLVPGKKMTYEARVKEGIEKIEVYVTNETKFVNGIVARVVWDRVWLNNELIEDTKDWYAQDNEGNVWYFGEDSKEIVNGKITSTAGSWEAGISGAKPGIIMKAIPKVGDSYRQEYYKGIAEDMGKVLALNEQVIIGSEIYYNCLKTLDFTPLEPGVEEHKYYCPEVGFVVLEVALENNEKAELKSIEYNSQPSPEQELEQLTTKVTESQAKSIALSKVSGTVTDVTIEKKFGKTAYVVEIRSNSGVETDVIIDIDAGDVLAIET